MLSAGVLVLPYAPHGLTCHPEHFAQMVYFAFLQVRGRRIWLRELMRRSTRSSSGLKLKKKMF